MRRAAYPLIALCFVTLGGTLVARAADWPTYQHDRARSGITTESMTLPLRPVWTFVPVVPPDPAWTLPAKEAPRVRFDDAYQCVVADGRVFFGSSGDNKVYALDAAAGHVLWTFFTDGPVRLAPSVWEGRLYFGSDDGFVYCLAAKDGQLVWKQRVAFGPDRVTGHGRVISLWPVRTSVLVDDGVAYFGAGVFPSESIYIVAADARTGRVLWRNDLSGDYGPEQDRDGISPQGFLLASEKSLYVPSGRNMPAAYDRQTGKFQFYLGGGKTGGTYALLTDDHLIAGTAAQRTYEINSKKRSAGGYAWSPAHRLIVSGAISYSLTDHEIVALDRSTYPAVAKERSTLDGARQKLQRDLRTIYRQRYRLDRGVADYQAQYDELTRQMEPMNARLKELSASVSRVEDKSYKWKRDNELRDSMILAGSTLFVGGQDQVIAVDADTGEWRWTGTLDGRASGLAVSDGRLFVSLNSGEIRCFAQGEPTKVRAVISPNVRPYPFTRNDLAATIERAADRIVRETGIRKGFCLVLGCGEGRLAYELAKRTDLNIYCIDPDADKVARVREAIDAAGLYGHRITVDVGSLSVLPYPTYFANLIVSEDLLTTGRLEASPEEMFRVLRPFGGVAYFGQPARRDGLTGAFDAEQITAWLDRAGGPAPTIDREDGLWASIERGQLAGAGSWTHQYGNPGNTANSGDLQLQTPLGILWFGRPGPERMIERHGRAAAPLFYEGRMFVQGENVVMAYDAYNGTQLWQREIAGAVRPRADVDGGNLAISDHGLFVARRAETLRLDPATGETLAVYPVHPSPDGEPRRWGWIATVDNTLFGTSAPPLLEEYGARWQNVSEDPIDNLNAYRSFNAGGGMWRSMQAWPNWGREDTWKGALTSRMIAGDVLFALDVESGQPRWKRNGTIGHCTIAIGDGLLYFADSKVTDAEKKKAVAERRAKYGLLTYEDEEITDYTDFDVRHLIAVDAVTGKTRWERTLDLTGAGGNKLGTVFHDGLLLIMGYFSNHDGGAFAKGGLKWRRVYVFNADDGSDLWSKELNYLRRPLVMGDELIVEPRSVNIRTGVYRTRYHPITGETVLWEFKRGGHSCGINTGSAYTFFLRSGSIDYYDFQKDQGMLSIGGTRAGCWINMIPAGGLALMPEASAGCTCSYPIRSTMVLGPKAKDRAWTIYVQTGPMTPVKHWFINFGAPGDRKDDEGNLWFGYPRLRLGYGVKFSLDEQVQSGLGSFGRSYEGEPVAKTDRPWVFTTGVAGLSRCTLPLIDDGQPAVRYTVRLAFCEHEHDQPGRRLFDIKLQGRTVLENFDIHRAGGGKNVAVIREFKDIRVTGALTVELVAKTGTVTAANAPLINGIEVHRQDP